MQKLMTLALCLTLGALAVACGDSGGLAGTYTFDADATKPAAEAFLKKQGLEGESLEKVLTSVLESKFEITIKDDGSWTGVFTKSQPSGSAKEETAKGTWTRDGDTLTINTTEEAGKPSKDTFKATVKGDSIEANPGDAPFAFVLTKK